MTNKKEVSRALIDAFDEEYYQKATVRSLAIAAVLRELVAELQYDTACWDEPAADMVLDARAILDVCDELEKLTTYD